MGGTICRSRPPEQISTTLVPLPGCITSRVIQAIEDAEKLLGKPPHVFQVQEQLRRTHGIEITGYTTQVILICLYQEDMIHYERKMVQISAHKNGRENF